VSFYLVGSVALAGYLWSGRSLVRFHFKGAAFHWSLFYDILKVGVVAAPHQRTDEPHHRNRNRSGRPVRTSRDRRLRLEYLMIPLVFGLGGPLVALVGTNIGAGQRERAVRAGWIGAAIAAGICEVIGLCAAVFPLAWLPLFDSDPAMLDAGTRYLHLGMGLYFASQGAGRLLWPWLANMARLVVAAGGGWLALRFGGNVSSVFLALAVSPWVCSGPSMRRQLRVAPGWWRGVRREERRAGTAGPWLLFNSRGVR
jgi:Na+-driven multidrug efflux pump